MRRSPRLFIPSLSQSSTTVLLEEDLHRYLVKVLRKKDGDHFWGIDPQGRLYELLLKDEKSEKPFANVIGSREPVSSKEGPSITIAQGLPKGQKIDLILRQCTEAGIDRFIPFLSKRCISRPEEGRSAKKETRWRKILQEASRQSGRVLVPSLDPIQNWEVLYSFFKDFDLILMPYEGKARPLSSVLGERPIPERVLVLIGPEGGWDPDEVLRAENAGAFSVHLPTPILRTETAALVTTAMLRFFFDCEATWDEKEG